MIHVILAMIQALLSMEKADEICSEDKTLTVEPYLYEPEELVQVHDDAGMVMMICI